MAKFTSTNIISDLPLGTILQVSYESTPPGFLECNGAAVSQALYNNLYIAIGYRWGNPGGGNFNLPDLRGAHLRGWAHGLGRDPDRASRVAGNPGGVTGDQVGSFQDDEFESHRHAPEPGAVSFLTHIDNYNGNGQTGASQNRGLFYWTNYVGGNETRPKNLYVQFIIKY